MRVGLYARVFTHDQHTLPLQWEGMHAYVKALAAQGLSKSAIASRLGISRTSVRRLLV
jgi:transposase